MGMGNIQLQHAQCRSDVVWSHACMHNCMMPLPMQQSLDMHEKRVRALGEGHLMQSLHATYIGSPEPCSHATSS